jgi:hypothetical protein
MNTRDITDISGIPVIEDITDFTYIRDIRDIPEIGDQAFNHRQEHQGRHIFYKKHDKKTFLSSSAHPRYSHLVQE